jgi:Tfp pilus assembly protein PilV
MITNCCQKGVTLLEVLIGFVIFTSSLVAILDYVGNQVYLNHLTDKNQRRTLLVYELDSVSGLENNEQASIITAYQDIDASAISEPLYEFKDGRKDMVLLQTLYSVGDVGNTFAWSVLEVR